MLIGAGKYGPVVSCNYEVLWGVPLMVLHKHPKDFTNHPTMECSFS